MGRNPQKSFYYKKSIKYEDLMDKELELIKRHLKGAFAALNKIDSLTNEKKSCNSNKGCRDCTCSHDDRPTLDGCPDTIASVKVAVFDTGTKQKR